jgi:regulatory protein YycI of two-component signal transduction system YycFG
MWTITLWVKPNYSKTKIYFIIFHIFFTLILGICLTYKFVNLDIKNKHIDFFCVFEI